MLPRPEPLAEVLVGREVVGDDLASTIGSTAEMLRRKNDRMACTVGKVSGSNSVHFASRSSRPGP